MAHKTILLIQDLSCVGRCSAFAALPVLCALGHHVVPLATALLSSHTAFKQPYIRDLSEDMEACLKKWASLPLRFDAILIGYLANRQQAQAALCAVKAYRKEGTLLCVDPAMGDHGRMYAGVEQEVVDFFGALCRKADLIFPNATEAALLLGRDPAKARADLQTLSSAAMLGAKNTVLTGYREKDSIGVLAQSGQETFRALAKEREGQWPGTGDLLSSAVTGGALSGLPLKQACELAVRFVKDAVWDAQGDPRYGVPFEGRLYQLTDAVRRRGNLRNDA